MYAVTVSHRPWVGFVKFALESTVASEVVSPFVDLPRQTPS
jgi:hypothetical protein